MNASEITQDFFAAHGRSNGFQAIRHFYKRIQNAPQNEVLDGLLATFEKRSFTVHDNACGILWALDIPYTRDLKDDLSHLIENWDVSTEELPWYLLSACGKTKLESVVEELLESEDDDERIKKLETVNYWISASEEHILEYKNNWKEKLN